MHVWSLSAFLVSSMEVKYGLFVSLALADLDAEALVARNAGGHVRRAIPDILALDSLVNLQNLFVIHHTDCGTTHFQDNKIQAILKDRVPEKAEDIGKMEFGMIKEYDQSVAL